MKNTARVGSQYENAYKALLSSRGYSVMRSAASKGPYDLVALSGAQCIHVQLTKRRMSCQAALLWAVSQLRARARSGCTYRYVHYTLRKTYCEHSAVSIDATTS